jgi:methylthioribose-1-phosphate isomerase
MHEGFHAAIAPITWQDDHLILVDQSALPHEHSTIIIRDYRDGIRAIKEMRVRGAPAIGIAGGFIMALAAREISNTAQEEFFPKLQVASEEIIAARPTAVDLAWAVACCLETAQMSDSISHVYNNLISVTLELQANRMKADKKISAYGTELLPEDGGVLTHCNTGPLATAGYGTALGVIRMGWERGKRFTVFCTETRPWLQGARLTTWELDRLNIPATLIVDSAVGWLMRNQEIDVAIVGADRITANGDVANKIGTYSIAMLAKLHNIPFYVAAPTSSIDLAIATGDSIPIEERPGTEILDFNGHPIAPRGIATRNPSFDVTPASHISAIITERGIGYPPFGDALTRLTR